MRKNKKPFFCFYISCDFFKPQIHARKDKNPKNLQLTENLFTGFYTGIPDNSEYLGGSSVLDFP